ncbi:uncharacterized protein BX664DRAFT_332776 [Halteromyces radiatus]|uniref:uncharacterized protein n=1 Tax=Halteromyces radiatus TaxID=101107 RepID=UPI00221EEDCF|nr:uncharacterized protein BX664DRAFT_332776 [Halteromyces radiatus]KAI8089345.1 hypothetical protein BX664DRAFT_332776 [Halteromyces radiatus]
MLVDLPPELLSQIWLLLPRSSLNEISQTSRRFYISALPTLYTTITLSFRNHIRQLQASLKENDKNGWLNHVIQQHTMEIVLKCKQSGQHRLVTDVRCLLPHLPHIHTLTLVDFHMLSVHLINPLWTALPHLQRVVLRYCDLVATPSIPFGLYAAQGTNTTATTTMDLQQQQQRNSSITTLELYWTDFPKTAIDALLSALPALSKVHFGANHNRHIMANNIALHSLQKYCSHVMDLDIGLQEVGDQTLVDCIAFYGTQLRRLSVPSRSPQTLFAITKYATQVQDLTVRFNLETNWISSPSSSTLTSTRDRQQHDNHLNNRTTQQQQQGNDEDQEEKGGLLNVLYQCQRLVRVQVVSMCPMTHNQQPMDQLPSPIRKALTIVAKRRRPPTVIQKCPSNINNCNRDTSSSTLDQLKRDTMTMTAAKEKKANHTSSFRRGDVTEDTTLLTEKTMGMKHPQGEKHNDNQSHMDRVNRQTSPLIDDELGNDDDDDDDDDSLEINARTTFRAQSSRPSLTNNSGTLYYLGEHPFQQRRPRDPIRIETTLILDNEQLQEIRTQAASSL